MKKTLIVSGMSCGNCVKHLREALEEDIDGIKVIDINLDNKCAVVDVKDNVTDEMIKNLIDDIGYQLEKIK